MPSVTRLPASTSESPKLNTARYLAGASAAPAARSGSSAARTAQAHPAMAEPGKPGPRNWRAERAGHEKNSEWLGGHGVVDWAAAGATRGARLVRLLLL